MPLSELQQQSSQPLFFLDSKDAKVVEDHAFYYPSRCQPNDKQIGLEAKYKDRLVEGPWTKEQSVLKSTPFNLEDENPVHDLGPFLTSHKDSSGSSKFEESWPSMEYSTPNILVAGEDLLGNVGNVDERDEFLTKFLGSKRPSQGLDNQGTLASFIHRFRNEPPRSRAARNVESAVAARDDEFWWLRAPSTSSTPKDGVTHPRKPPPSPKSSKRSPSKDAQAGSTPTRNLTLLKKDEIDLSRLSADEETDNIQRRAVKLLEMSEDALSSSFTVGSTPENGKKKVPSQDLHVKEAVSNERSRKATQSTNQPVTPNVTAADGGSRKLPLRQEEDILYQWRLARKMEVAQSNVSLGGSWPFLGSDKTARTFGRPASDGQDEQRGASSLERSYERSTVVEAPSSAAPERQLNVGQQQHQPQRLDLHRPVQHQMKQHDHDQHDEAACDKAGESTLVNHHRSSNRPADVLHQCKPFPGERPPCLWSLTGTCAASLPSRLHVTCDIQRQCGGQIVSSDHDRISCTCGQVQSQSGPIVSNPACASNQRPPANRDSCCCVIAPSSVSSRDRTSGVVLTAAVKRDSSDEVSSESSQSSSREILTSEAAYAPRKSGDMSRSEILHASSAQQSDLQRPRAVSSAIAQVVSDRLFLSPHDDRRATVSPRTDDLPSVDDDADEDLSRKSPDLRCGYDWTSSDEEFPDDEILQELRERRTAYIDKLRSVEEMLTSLGTGDH